MIGLEIKLLRERLKLSAKDLAERVGLSPSQISRLESGQRRVDAVLLSRISKELGVHPSYFFKDADAGAAGLGPRPAEAQGDAATADAAGDAAGGAALLDEPVAHLGRLLRDARHRQHMTADELAQRVGKGRTFIQDVEEGRTELLTGDVLLKLARALKLDPEALLQAQRAEIRDLRRQLRRVQRAHADQTLGQLDLEGPGSTRRGVPIVAGPGGELPARFDGKTPEGQVVEYCYVPGLRVSSAFAVTWKGDEMRGPSWPSFVSGDVLVFSPDREARHRDLVLAVLEGASVFRQLFLDPKGRVRLQPLNLDYPPLILDRDEVRELFPLVARLGTLNP